MTEAIETTSDLPSLNLACFEVKGQTYAVEVARVGEIVRMMEITPLPHAPSLIEGVIDLRGVVIPVIDLARLLGRGRGDRGSQARIVVLGARGLTLGLLVDAATDVLTFPRGRAERIPGLATSAGYDLVECIVRPEAGPPIMVLSADRLIARLLESPPGSQPLEATG